MSNRKNPFHNFTTEAITELVEEHNNEVADRNLMPRLNVDNPQIKRSIERGKRLAEQMAKQELKQLR